MGGDRLLLTSCCIFLSLSFSQQLVLTFSPPHERNTAAGQSVNRLRIKRQKQRLTFPFPFVHHQPHDWKVEQLLTVERRTLCPKERDKGSPVSTVNSVPFPLLPFSVSRSTPRQKEEGDEERKGIASHCLHYCPKDVARDNLFFLI